MAEQLILLVSAFPGKTKKAMVYFSQETKQLWSANGSKQQQDAGAEAIDGGALWLPGNVVLELQMLPMVQPATHILQLPLMVLFVRARCQVSGHGTLHVC